MKVLVVSDVHYMTGERRFFHGIDESVALKHLTGIVKATKPDELIGLGDFGYGWTRGDWDALAGFVRCDVIYGNHDAVEVLREATNSDATPVNPKDGEIRAIGGFRFGFINGIVDDEKPAKEGVPRIKSKDFMSYASKFRGIDFFCTHSSPYIDSYGTRIRPIPSTKIVNEFAKSSRPRYILSGHIGFEYYSVEPVSGAPDTIDIRVDTSQRTKSYCLIDTETEVAEVYVGAKMDRKLGLSLTSRQG